MKTPGITVHCTVKNEERWIWYALHSVLPYVEKILVYDTGSTDKTVPIIQSIQSPKINLEERGAVTKEDFHKLCQEQVDRTETEWFLVLDGDEIWPSVAIEELADYLKKAPAKIDTIVAHFNNFLNDVFHYQPENEGGYLIDGQRGNLTVKVMRTTIPGLHVSGDYGVEGYLDGSGKFVQERTEHLHILTQPFFHTSNLVRSSSLIGDWKIGYRRLKVFVGAHPETRPELNKQIHQLFSEPVPITHFSPLKKDYPTVIIRSLVVPLLKTRQWIRQQFS